MPEEQIEQTADSSVVDSDAGFEAGFAGAPATAEPPKSTDTPETPAPAAEVAATPEAPQTPEQPPEAAETPPVSELAGVKAELESIKGRLANVDALPTRLRNVEGHIGNINSQLKTALASAAAKAVEKSGGDAPTQQQIASAVASGPKWKQLKEDFPDWAEASEEREAALEARIKASIPPAATVDVNGIKTEVANHLAQYVQNAKSEARELARIDAKHEDWEDTVKTPDFRSWLEKQAPETRALSSSAKAKDAIALLDAFKASAKPAANKEQQRQRLERATTPKGVPAATPASIDDEEAFEDGFKKSASG